MSQRITGTGGSKGTGGAKATGGSKATGGKTGTGGSKATGGKTSTGGSKATGGASTGGSKATGGTKATGGSSAAPVCSPPNCDDSNPCTTDTCSVGTCTHTPVANGTACNDGNACTQTDSCHSGACVGNNPVVCTALDACHVVGTCNASTGTCSNPNASTGASCSDGNACNGAETCNGSGTCVPGTPVVCIARDSCHAIGTCNPSTGTCSSPVAADGTTCTDSNACTQTDACQTGTCVGTDPVPVDDGNSCTVDSCDPVLGAQHTPNTSNPTCAQWYPAGLQLKVQTASCIGNQAQQYFQVTNMGSSPVSLSDITIKFWVNDTSGSDVVGQVNYPGCARDPNSCFHQLSNVTAVVAPVLPACGPDANHQASWEVTVATTDGAQLAPGQMWDQLQVAVHLASYNDFSPGTNTWFSPCLSGNQFVADNHFGVYYQGKLIYSSGISAPDCRAPRGQTQLSGHISSAMAAAPLVGKVPGSTQLRIGIGLPMRDPVGLRARIAQISDPKSPTYRQGIPTDEFVATYSPLGADYQALIDFAGAHGLTVVGNYPNRFLLGVTGTAADIERAFFVNMNYYLRPDGSQFYRPDRDPSITISAPVNEVTSLNNYSQPQSAIVPGGNGTGTGGNYLSRDLRKAYAGCTNLNGQGQSIGLAAFGGYHQADLDAYASAAGLTNVLPPIFVPLSTYSQELDTSTYSGLADGTELSIDIEMALAMAPAAQVYVFGGEWNSFNEALTAMAAHGEISQFSISYEGLVIYDQGVSALAQMASNNQTIYVASGDNGAYLSNIIGDLRSSADVTVVGGTALSMDGTGESYLSESTWYGSGGGTIPGQVPDYQTLDAGIDVAAVGGDPTRRNVPDVSAVAQQQTEAFLTCGQPGVNCACPPVPSTDDPNARNCIAHPELTVQHAYQATAGGTSVSAPLWAGFTALVNQALAPNKAVGKLNPTLYDIGKSKLDYVVSFNDINDGSKNTSGSASFTAGTGFDLATGWGSPRCGLIGELVSRSPANIQAVSAGHLTTCALRQGGAVSCWGLNHVGQLGNGTTSNSSIPVPATGITNATSVASSNFMPCALIQDGTVQCWGFNGDGQLGTGTTAPQSSTPVTIAGLTNVTALATGGLHGCAIIQDGTVQCWGNNANGQLGGGTTAAQSAVPVTVPGLSGVTAIIAMNIHSCALLSDADRTVKCWGNNDAGQLGDGSTTNSATPVSVSGLSNVSAIAGGEHHTCALRSDGTVRCWGFNGAGELGDGQIYQAAVTPVTVSGLTDAIAISAGGDHTCAIRTDNTVWCWGGNEAGEIGAGTIGDVVTIPTAVVNLGTAKAISLGTYHSCAITPNGNLACWGLDNNGQLGDGGDEHERSVPGTVSFW